MKHQQYMDSYCAFEGRKARAIHKLRELYRMNYSNGESDESFLLWIEENLARAAERGEDYQPE